MGGLTNFPNGLSSFGIPVLPGIPVPFNGNYFFVNESVGLDGNSGLSANQPLKTLARAQALCTAGNNDTVLFWGTIHTTASLAWAKNQTHLIGIDAPLRRGKRARISSSGTTAFDKLIDTTGASGCYFGNFGTFYGFNDASANICLYEAGGRNCYDNVEILGFGDGTASTGTANHTAARAVTIAGSTGENTFYNCVFGVDTVTRNATNYTVEINGNSPRNHFEECEFEAYLGASGGAAAHLLIGAAGIDRYVRFKNCWFRNATKSGATAMNQVMALNAAIGGSVELSGDTGFNGASAWETSTTNQAYLASATPSGTGGKATNNT